MRIHNGDSFFLYHSNCLDVLRQLEENSVDAVVTDPPYGLSFMGSKWDYDVPSEEIWKECLRVLKPGGHLVAFASTRTQHRMACRIEDAGFEIRDMIAWLYGSGFPKSHNISKAIDKLDAKKERERRAYEFTAWMRSTGIKASLIREVLQCGASMPSHYLTAVKQPQVATAEVFDKLRPYLPAVPEHIEALVHERTVESENMKSREVIEEYEENSIDYSPGQDQTDRERVTLQRTVAHSPEAQQWEGWGTALKPSLEPITVARKPIAEDSIAENILVHGTGAFNIDACRVETNDKLGGGNQKLDTAIAFKDGWERPWMSDEAAVKAYVDRCNENVAKSEELGRWPANLLHDGSEDVVALFPSTKATRPSNRPVEHIDTQAAGWGFKRMPSALSDNGGSAARYFYCAKASKADRDEGLDAFQDRRGGPEDFDAKTRDGVGELRQILRKNIHPTVKPTSLMQWLCRLVCPPNGIILDPFMGSGSTGKAAVLEGFNFVGCEMDGDFFDIASARIDHAANPGKE